MSTMTDVIEEDKTSDFLAFIEPRLAGLSSIQPLVTFRDNTSPNGTGNEHKARGEVTVSLFGGLTGTLTKLQFSGLGGQVRTVWDADLKLAFDYTGNSTGEYWLCYEGHCNPISTLWKDQFTRGTAELFWRVEPQMNGVIKTVARTDEKSEAALFVRDMVTPGLAWTIRDVIKSYIGTSPTFFLRPLGQREESDSTSAVETL